ncbi:MULTISPECIES: hypothetical protein [unclassified Bradyrhizobium]|uniref:hypothetical protein n=1 Tax=unclassified Bradyrhizobium TaxID=2631580 RepID=UPI002FF11836
MTAHHTKLEALLEKPPKGMNGTDGWASIPGFPGGVVEDSAPASGASDSVGYPTYIGSHAWKTNQGRLAELRASGYRCRICNASRAEARLEVHHRTYENLGRERMADLTTLCAPCHVVVTCELRARRYANQPVAATADFVPSADPAPLFDSTYATGGV